MVDDGPRRQRQCRQGGTPAGVRRQVSTKSSERWSGLLIKLNDGDATRAAGRNLEKNVGTEVGAATYQ
jgi:hypothetical protein